MEYISIIIAVVSVIFSVITYMKNVAHDRKQATLDAFSKLQTEVFDELNHITKSEIAEISNNPRSSEYKELSKNLARIEHFCVGINTKVYDLKIVKRLAGRYIIVAYEKYLPMIERKRNINQSAKHYDEFETAVNKLKKDYEK